MLSVSFDIFFQRFKNGDLAEGDRAAVESLRAPLVERRDDAWARIRTIDGEADLYGVDSLGSHLLINHASGRAIWDVMFELARIGVFAVMPVGCGTYITDSTDRSDLPSEAPEPITVVHSGQDLLDVVESA